jgi:hypothetical protein
MFRGVAVLHRNDAASGPEWAQTSGFQIDGKDIGAFRRACAAPVPFHYPEPEVPKVVSGHAFSVHSLGSHCGHESSARNFEPRRSRS